MPGMDFFSRFGQGAGPNVNPQTGGVPQTSTPSPGLMNPSAMQFLNFMMTQPGANYDPGNLPGFGTPWSFGVPQTVTAPTPRPQPPAPAPGTGGTTSPEQAAWEEQRRRLRERGGNR